ncbi:MAG: hypothetical protein ACI8RH_000021 [Flavobacteriales bacterium]|jgi:hypothetical protein
MKKLLFVATLAIISAACNQTKNNKTIEVPQELAVTLKTFGADVASENILSQDDIIQTYQNLKSGDTLDVTFKAKVASVCQSKGCWMRVDVGEQEAMVKFKDYAFFMPKDLAGQEVVIQGKAFVAEVSVDEQRHYAEDAGKSEEEVLAITEVQKTLSFESSGVLIPDAQSNK